MKITDKIALREMKLVRCPDLDETVALYPEDERDGRSDLQFLADEVSYIRSCYEENGHVFCDDLERAREILRVTKNGKVMPLWPNSLIPMYNKRDIENARYTINEYRRIRGCERRLRERGYYGSW